MSLFLTGLSGFATTLAIAAGAFYFTEAKPAPEWEVGKRSSWTAETAAASIPFERVPARAASPSSKTSAAAKNTEAPPVDMITTGALPGQKPQNSSAAPTSVETTTAHARWCTEHYRSYRQDDNSYRAYSGNHRACVSPFSDTPNTHNNEPFDYEGPTADRTYARFGVGEEKPTTHFNSRHIASCLARYRSYNPDDNSYQPFGGQSPRQCE
ncbi:BA14K family protein [Mesorhizobium sp. IMUNJ 23232]|uniref:BA14K family protein n=1 Tax=Mesorhizobium sp. IMUNJ 23232 TaxID=3376064 RepID=UPI00379A677B